MYRVSHFLLPLIPSPFSIPLRPFFLLPPPLFSHDLERLTSAAAKFPLLDATGMVNGYRNNFKSSTNLSGVTKCVLPM